MKTVKKEQRPIPKHIGHCTSLRISESLTVINLRYSKCKHNRQNTGYPICKKKNCPFGTKVEVQ